jgi:hypothetical protein
VYYPTALLNEELVNPEHPDDFAITKESDKRVLDATSKKLDEYHHAGTESMNSPPVWSQQWLIGEVVS